MTREEGLQQIDAAQWQRDDFGCLHLLVANKDGAKVDAWLVTRPPYCDRGHIQFNIDAPCLYLDGQDSFPRYFFSFAEANLHARMFLKWRIWQERSTSAEDIRNAFE